MFAEADGGPNPDYDVRQYQKCPEKAGVCLGPRRFVVEESKSNVQLWLGVTIGLSLR